MALYLFFYFSTMIDRILQFCCVQIVWFSFTYCLKKSLSPLQKRKRLRPFILHLYMTFTLIYKSRAFQTGIIVLELIVLGLSGLLEPIFSSNKNLPADRFYYSSTNSWRGYYCLYSLYVCLFGHHHNSSRMMHPILMLFQWCKWLLIPLIKGQGHGDFISIFG